MTRYLLDTNHAGDLLKVASKLASRISSAPQLDLGIPMPAVAELWYMVHNSSRVAENAVQLRKMLIALRQVEFDASSAEEFGSVKASLRRSGRMIPDVDIQIASIAKVNEMTVLTADAHFAYVSGITTENWIC